MTALSQNADNDAHVLSTLGWQCQPQVTERCVASREAGRLGFKSSSGYRCLSREVQTRQRLFSSKVRSECWRTVMSSVQGPVRRVLSCHPKSFLSVVEGPVRLSPKVSVVKGAIQCWRTCRLFQVLSNVMSCRARSFLSVVEGPVRRYVLSCRVLSVRCGRSCPVCAAGPQRSSRPMLPARSPPKGPVRC